MAFNENSYWLKPPAASNTGRALTFGGYSSQNVIDYFNSGSAGNATDFGDLCNGGSEGEAQANGTYALFYLGRGSSTNNNIIEKVNISSTTSLLDLFNSVTEGTSDFKKQQEDSKKGNRFGGKIKRKKKRLGGKITYNY